MSVALDLGAHTFRSLTRKDGGLVGRKTRTAYCLLPDTPGCRKYLATLRIPAAKCDSHLAVLGDSADEVAAAFGVPLRGLLPDGVMPAGEPVERQILSALVDSILPEPRFAGELCCLALPGDATRRPSSAHRAQEFFSNLAQLRGYRPLTLSAAMALVLAELGDDGFTGISITLGAARSQICLAHCGREIFSETLAMGGDWLDAELASRSHDYAWDAQGHRYLNTAGAKQRREACSGTIVTPASPDERLLAELHAELLQSLVEAAGTPLAQAASTLHLSQPLRVVCTGGLTRINGFGELLQAALKPPLFPVPIKAVRLIRNVDYAIARGLLIHAELEAETARAA